jgi:hypothetical protein
VTKVSELSCPGSEERSDGHGRAARLEQIAATDGRAAPQAVALQRRVNRLALVNLGVLLSTVWAMVAKPSW